ncbi:MAG: beta-lactamase family protein [Rikenellaceae bacterium]|nr:beta-lactamase family protein [Rikenellaceae bacterium]MBR4052060.1 beta-lactamase family protein [Alistipes sp.]
MHRYKLLIVLLMMIAGLTLTIRSCQPAANRHILAEEEEIRYRLNDSIRNAFCDFKETERMERYLKNWMARYNIRGAQLAIMDNERLIYAKGFGWADQQDSVLLEAGDILRIASASKLITAIGVMKLCEEGKLTTESPVFGPQGILNDSIFLQYKDKRVPKITVHHLLNHTSGFSRRMGDPMFRSADLIRWTGSNRKLTEDEVIAFQLGLRLRDNPGGSAQYSNVGYLVLSRVIEEASGMTYEDYIRKHVLEPAGCYDMQIARNFHHEKHRRETTYYGHAPEDLIESYDGSGLMRPREYGGHNIEGLQGAGAWVCSAAELLRLVASIDGLPGVPDILSKESIQKMTTLNRKGDFPYGWARMQAKGGVLTRTGTMSGTSAYIKSRPGGVSYVLITNTSSYRGASFTNRIGQTIDNALTRVKEWPETVDLFNETPKKS